MLEFIGQSRSPIVAFDRTEVGGLTQQQANLRLFHLRDQERAHAAYSDRERVAADLPSIGGLPARVFYVSAAKRPPHVASCNFPASVKKNSIGATCDKLWVDVNTPLGNDLEGSLTFNKAREPRPFDILVHEDISPQTGDKWKTGGSRQLFPDV